MSHDTIKAYLDSPLVPDEEIKAAGGVLKYWELALELHKCFLSAPGQFLTQQPQPISIQISYLCLPPASSVDAEHSFSCGRLQVNHLQHNIGSQFFKAQMAAGSWLQTPLLSIDHVTNVIRDGMSHSHAKGKSRAVDDSDDIIMVDP